MGGCIARPGADTVRATAATWPAGWSAAGCGGEGSRVEGRGAGRRGGEQGSEGMGRCGSGCDGRARPAARRGLHSMPLLLMHWCRIAWRFPRLQQTSCCAHVMAGPGARWYELCEDSICSCEKQGLRPSALQAAASSAVATSTVPVQPVGAGWSYLRQRKTFAHSSSPGCGGRPRFRR